MVPPNAKPVELAPNAGLAGVPKVLAVVAAAAPKVNGAGAGAGAGLEAGVDDAPPPPKVKGFGGAADEPKVDAAAGASNAGFPKVKVDWVVAAAAVEEVLAMAKPPNEAVVVFWLGAVCPKEKTFWLAA